MSPDAQVSNLEGHIFLMKLFEDWLNSVIYLADNVPHLLSMDDVWGVDDSCVTGSVHLSGLLVLSLRNRKLSSAQIRTLL